MNHHVTKHPGCVETVQVVPTRDEVRISRFVEFEGSMRLASELVCLTWEQASHVYDRLAAAFIDREAAKIARGEPEL